MQNEPRTYQHSAIQRVVLILVFGLIGIGLFVSMIQANFWLSIPIVLFLGIVFLVLLYSMTSKTTISDVEISTQTILGTKTLAWNAISRVSGRGNAIKLHNNFGDVTVAPNQQLPGYDEIVEQIGRKRPDLFNPMEYAELSKSLAGTIFLPLMGLLFIGLGIFVFSQENDTLFSMLMLSVIGLVFIGIPIFSPRTLSLQGNSLVISYLFNQKTLQANEVSSIDLRYVQTRNGKRYYVAINLKNSRLIRVSGFNPNLPVVYLVLKNWHEKNATIRQTS